MALLKALDEMKEFAVGLSFASDTKALVEVVAGLLAHEFTKKRVFLDSWHASKIRGRNTNSRLASIYRDRCELVVPFFSREYQKRPWTNAEWNAIREAMFSRHSEDCVLPVHMEDNVSMLDWPGFGVGVPGREANADQIARDIIEFYHERIVNDLKSEHGDPQIRTETQQEIETRDTLGQQISSSNQESAGKTDDVTAISHSAADYGTLLAIDIINSSNLPGQQIRQVIVGLRDTVVAQLEKAKAKSQHIASFLDGLIAAIKGASHPKLLDAIQAVISDMSSRYGVSLRCALHRGDFHYISNPDVIVGKAAAECVRLARLAGPGQVVVSHEFVENWEHEYGVASLPALTPELAGKPWEISPKPGEVSRFRLFVSPFGQKQASQALQEISQANQALKRVLENLRLDFDELVEDNAGIKPKQLRSRVSLFVPSTDGRVLIATTHRYLRFSEPNRERLEQPGTIRYSLENGESTIGPGPLGHAFCCRVPKAVNDLPICRGRGDAYARSLEVKPWKLTPTQIQQMGRHARAFLAIPVSYVGLEDDANGLDPSTPKPPDGIICLDTKSPISEMQTTELEDIGVLLSLDYGTQIAALWRLRR